MKMINAFMLLFIYFAGYDSPRLKKHALENLMFGVSDPMNR